VVEEEELLALVLPLEAQLMEVELVKLLEVLETGILAQQILVEEEEEVEEVLLELKVVGMVDLEL
jgi:hypothetical protein